MNAKVRLILTFLCLSLLMACPHSALGQRNTLIGAWVSMDRWEAAPKDIQPDLRAAGAQILYFEADGTFTIWSGTLYSQNHHSPTISAGDGESLYSGTWKQTRSGPRIVMRKVYADLRINGENFPGPEQTLDAKWMKKKLWFRNYWFNRSPSLDTQMIGYAQHAKAIPADEKPGAP